LRFDASLLTLGFNLDESQTQFAGRIHRMIRFGLSIDDADEGLGDDDDLLPLEEVDGAAADASELNKDGRIHCMIKFGLSIDDEDGGLCDDDDSSSSRGGCCRTRPQNLKTRASASRSLLT